MELTRDDAMAALWASGVEPGAVDTTDNDSCDVPTRTMVSLAETLYPSVVEVTADFVETYLLGRVAADDTDRERLVEGAEILNYWAGLAFGRPFPRLDRSERARLLDEDMGVGLEDPVPDGSEIERLRFHTVDEIVFAFYASPTGKTFASQETALVGTSARETYRPGPP